MTDKVLREDKDGLAILTLNRPDKLNALTVEVFADLEAHVEAIEREPDAVGLVILRGAGRCFSAGHDLADLAAGEPLPRPAYQSHVIEKLAALPQPVLSAVHGHCYTGALELALAGDIMFAAEDARFADTHARWGLSPFWGMSQRLPRRVGQAKAHEMMLTCATYSGAEAAAIGLANRSFPDETFFEEVEAMARQMLENSWFSHRANKRLLRETDGLPLPAGIAHEVYNSPGVGPDAADRLATFARRKG